MCVLCQWDQVILTGQHEIEIQANVKWDIACAREPRTCTNSAQILYWSMQIEKVVCSKQSFKGLIRFCHFKEKTKSLTSDLWLKEGIWHRLKILRCSLVVHKPLWFFSLCEMPSFNYKSNFWDFVFLAEWQNLIGPFLHVLKFPER